MTLAVMIVLAAVVGAWVLAPLFAAVDAAGSGRGVTSDPSAGRDESGEASAARHEGPRWA